MSGRSAEPSAAPVASGDAAFDQLTDEYLAGYFRWRPQTGTALGLHQYDGKLTDYGRASLDIELTSGGTAVLEKFHMVDNGKPVEMTTLYYLDGEDVKLTHYCMAGNQPTMRGTYAPDSRTLIFELVSISNLKNADAGHMHHATYTFLDNDHFKTTWTFRKDQKDAFTEDVTYVRVK